jgi:hypothetical protein
VASFKPDRFTAEEHTSGIYLKGDFVEATVDLNAVKKTNGSYYCRELNPDSLVIEPG